MREEGFVTGSEDVRLTVEILVPSAQVGRIIGKGGQNVRELQRVTGSVIKLSEQQATPLAADEETTVHIIGPFFSVQVKNFHSNNSLIMNLGFHISKEEFELFAYLLSTLQHQICALTMYFVQFNYDSDYVFQFQFGRYVI